MGIPQYSQLGYGSGLNGIGIGSSSNNYNSYESEPSSEKTYFEIIQSQSTTLDPNYDEKPSMVSEYLEKGFSTKFAQKYNRELTVIASSLSVLILLTIGACVWCLLGILKRDYRAKDDDNSSSKKSRKGDGDDDPTDELDSSCGVSDLSVEAGNTGKKLGGVGTARQKIPIISKIFSKQNGNGARILAQHRNIITPDKSIPFVVPTIQLPAQPRETCRKAEGSVLCDEHHHPTTNSEPQPSSSKTSKQTLLQAQQFFPQLEHPESDSCPLIAFTLFYELSTQILNVRLLEGRNFPDSVNHTVSVKVYPGRSGKQATKEFRTRSPVYNVEFCFHVRKSSLQTKILKLRAVIPGSPKRIIGYVNVALKDIPGFDFDNEIVEDLTTAPLWRRVELPSDIGDGVKLRVSLKWSAEPSPGLLTLKIIEAAGLHENRDCNYSSSYVKVTLQEQGRNVKTRKTQLVRWGSVPVFDDMFVLSVPRELLRTHISFLLVVVARGRLGSKAVLGKIIIGPVPYSVRASGVGAATSGDGGGGAVARGSSSPTSSSTGTEIWEDMCHQPDTEIVRWLHLLP